VIGRQKEKSASAADGAQSWRDLAGPRRSRVNSPQARRRRRAQWLRLGLALLLLGGLLAAAVAVFRMQDAEGTERSIAAPSRPIERIIFDTDGVLPEGWLGSVIELKAGTGMMEADIHALKAALEAEAQVKSARVERVFPSSLQIVIEERTPVLRLAVAGPDGKARQKLVARDGTIYDGVGYPRSMLANLPFLEPYRHPQGAYLPLEGIERVAQLLESARRERPDLFATWRVVSLRHYSGDLDLPGQVIEIRSKLVPRIIFGAAADFGRQLDRLDYILAYVRQRGNPSMERIDLSLRGSAAVQFTSGRVGTF